MRNYTTQHEPGAHLNFSQRQTLASDWNAIVNAGCRITLRQFAAKHGLRYETWRREYLRGATGAAVPDPKDRRRRKYAEYDPFKAQDAVNENNANKGTRMLVTNQMAFLFRRHVIDEKLSPYDALCHMKEEMPGRVIPCLSTWYRHINAGDVGVRYGETPYHPNRRPKGPKPHPAMTVPWRLTLDDRPAGATRRSRFGHYEMDTVVSSTNGTGGLLVLVDRKSRRYVIEKLEHVTQDDVVAALRRMLARKALGRVRSVTTDNGCEFLDPEKIKAVVGCNVYYTRAYASWEKGSVENCNRFVRRWYPKGTDFGRCARKDSREAMIRLGGMLHDLECYVDNCLRFDSDGDVVGRNGGIRGWLRENLPELSPKYKTLMRYKAMAVRLRQATETNDPTPTSALLDREPRHEVVAELLADGGPAVFARLFQALERRLSPETVFLDAPKRIKRRRRKRRAAKTG